MTQKMREVRSFLHWSIEPVPPSYILPCGGKKKNWGGDVLFILEFWPALQALIQDFGKLLPVGRGDPVRSLVSSFSTTFVMYGVQRTIEWVQLWRLQRKDPPLNYYFPGVEFLLASLGIVLGAAAQFSPYVSFTGALTLIFLAWLLLIEEPHFPPLIEASASGTTQSPSWAESRDRPFQLSLLILAIVSLTHA